MFRAMVLAAICGSTFLTGCTTIERIDAKVSKNTQEMAAAKADVIERFPSAGLVRLDRPLIVDAVKSRSQHQQSHPILDAPIQFNSLGSQTVAQIMQTISSTTGLKIDIQEVLQEAASNKQDDSSKKPLINTQLQYSFEGSLRNLFDDLASKLEASWRFDQKTNSAQFFRYENRVFGLMLPPGAKKVDASISIGGGSSGGASGGSVSINSDTKINPWQSTLGGIGVLLGSSATESSSDDSSMIKGAHGYAIVNRDLAQIIVVARPHAMSRIANYIEQTNRRFARNVLIDVRVLEFQSNDGAQAGVRADALIEKAFRSGPISQLNVSFNGATLSSIASGSPSTVTIGAAGKQTNSSQVTLDSVIQALDSVSRVSVRNQGQIVAINGQPAPFQQANQITYLASTTTTQVPDAGTKVSRTPGTVTVGFTANFVPTVLADNRIMLQYQIQSSSLLGLKTIGNASDAIQMPEVFTQSLQQQAYLNDGDVIALFGFDQDRSQVANSSGLLSKSRSATQNNIQTAVLIQVRVAK